MNNNSSKKYKSLSRNLVFWFLLISTLPLIIVSFIGYQQTRTTLDSNISKSLKQSSSLTVRFIKNWFKYRFMDISIQAESNENVKILKSLINGFSASEKSLSDYVKSYDWARRVDGLQDNLFSLSRRYDYLHDLLILDDKGNLLFTIAHELDLGTNMFNGPYAKTLFSQSIKNTLKTGHILFSDMERYAPSNNIVAGFITAPILDEYGDKLGVFAMQLRADKMFEVVKKHFKKESSLTHYLVGEDGRLRTTINDDNDVLVRKINTRQFKLWKKERSVKYSGKYEYNLSDISTDGATFEYTGPEGAIVIGQHQALNLPGVNWVLISEIDKDEAFASINLLFNLMFILFFLTVIIVIFWAVYQAKRITQPIVKLVDASLAATEGNIKQKVKVDVNNEIAQLADVFNHMLDVRKRHESELEQTTAQAEMAFSELSEQKFALDQHSIVAITDIKGTITVVNKKFCEVSGYKEEEFLGENHRMLNSGVHDEEFFSVMYRTIGRGDVWHNEVCNKAKDGHLYWLDTTIVPFMSKDGKPKSYITIGTDITERTKAELELVNAKETAEAATQQKSEFLANMSHEIRTPMNGVIGMTGLLLDTELEVKQRSYAQSAMSSAEALLAIINDILDFSKIEAGKMELEILPFDLQALMEDVSELMAIKCREKNIEMLLRFKPGTVTNVIGDPGRIRQILLNILSNAIKFTEQGSVVLTVESSEVIDGNTVISASVSDSGIGIDDDKLDKIFNKFDQEDGSTTRKYGGTGLGLAICRQLCHLMEGDIKVESHKGHGSVFNFTIKLAVTAEDVVSSLAMGDESLLQGLKTLIVDDIYIAQTILCEQLSGLNLKIETALSGRIALEKLNSAIADKDPFDIVITDFHMPEMDGEMLAAKIKENKLLEQGALLFITSSPRKGDGSRLKKLGFDGYLTKPTRALEVPQIMTLIWSAKQERKDIPLVTRHMLQEVKTGNKQKIKLTNAHILLAEDNPVNQMVATEYLERYGCTVTPAGNGLEAITQLKNSNFDLIFMDCQMPEMDGYEATGVIREWEKSRKLASTPIIAFTANAMQGDKDKCLAAGMDDYISKPVSEKSLEDILKKWLSEKIQMTEFTYDEDVLTENNKSEKEDVITNDNKQLDLSVFNTLKEMFGDTFSVAVGSHASSAKDNLKRIENAIEKGDASELEHAAHSLKGASGQFGAMRLSKLAEQMEQFGKDAEIEKAKGIIDELKILREEVEKLMLNKMI
ncbi:MAG: response regulator [Gammaproteobacteria bacterium]|nr:response regulator [Gammaproteobacteria bacterium]